ncbi:MAG: DUF4340 domain-containing protein [Planctomycetota bacterium]
MKKNESARTITFVIGAAALALVAGLVQWTTSPSNPSDFELVGDEFYPDFQTAADARSLEVFAIDPEEVEMQEFRIRQKDGVWVIPSHYDYPAEAAERIARTATSMIGLRRESLVGRLETEHEKFGVVDPLQEEFEDLDGVGKRITLKDSNNNVLVDFIVGKEAGEDDSGLVDPAIQNTSDPDRYFYVRRADEKQTYKVKFEIDLSTRFRDWIEPDLLDIEIGERLVRRNFISRDQLDQARELSNQQFGVPVESVLVNGEFCTPEDVESASVAITSINIDNYQRQPMGDGSFGRMQGDKLELSRESEMDPWQLGGLFEEQEQLVEEPVNSLVGVLANLEIAGVRPKHTYKGQQLITPDLKLNPIEELQQDPRLFQQEMARVGAELRARGFDFEENPEIQVVSNGGMMTAGTDQGVRYYLHFGNVVSGSDEEIEIGAQAEAGTAENADETADPDSDETEAEVRNRYLMVRALFDPALLGEPPARPIEPVEPRKPEDYELPPEDDEDRGIEAGDELEPMDDPAPPPSDLDTEENEGSQSSDTDAAGDGPAVDEPAGENESGEGAQDESTDDGAEDDGAQDDSAPEPPMDEEERPQAWVDYEIAIAQYADLKVQFDMDMVRFEQEVEAYATMIEEGQKTVDTLNERFGRWYYVISATDLSALQIARSDIVVEKEMDDSPLGDPPGMFNPVPQRPDLGIELPNDFVPSLEEDVPAGAGDGSEGEEE